MSGRIVIREGAIEAESADVVVPPAALPPGADREAALRASFRASLETARRRGARSLAAPALGTGRDGLTVQRSAEILIEEARAHLAAETSLEEIRFVVAGEPTYRVFESVKDAARIAEQMERLRTRS